MRPDHFWLAVLAALLVSIAVGHLLERLARPCCAIWNDSQGKAHIHKDRIKIAVEPDKSLSITFTICARHAHLVEEGYQLAVSAKP